MNFEMVPFAEGEALLDWQRLIKALEAGHLLPKAEIGDTLLYRGPDTLLSRSAWIDGMGLAVKSATVFPGNSALGKPTTNGGVCLYSDSDGTLEALIDFHLVTKWKTAGDSLLAASRLARQDSESILIVGAGTVARSMIEALGSQFPKAGVSVWNRTKASAEKLVADFPAVRIVDDLEAAVRAADIISCSTMATDPVVKGEWLRPGQHIDLIGAYRPDMREVDDEAIRRSRVFVDSRATTVDHIGELKIPIENKVISRSDIVADFYDIKDGLFERSSNEEITLFKNGGGAHLDLMTSRHILDAWRNR